MQKRGNFFGLHSAIFQVVLLIGASFALSFFLGENLAVAQFPGVVGARAAGGQAAAVPTAADSPFNLHAESVLAKNPTNVLSPSGSVGGGQGLTTVAGGAGASGASGAGAAGAATSANVIAPYQFKLPFTNTVLAEGAVGHLLSGAMWAGIAYFGIQALGNLFGFDEGLTNALSYGAVGGILTWKALSALGPTGTNTFSSGFLATNPGLIGIGVGAIIFVATYKKEKREIVRFECFPWEAPIGGKNCEECNNDPSKPCSEYRCKSLGQACEIVNKGTEDELCVWVNRADTQSPSIEPWDDALKPRGLRYIPDTAIRPPHRGWKLVANTPDGCLPAFTQLEFGILLDEPGQCKIDYEASNEYKTPFDEMQFFVGESNLFSEEHSQRFAVPDPFNQEDGLVPEIHNDGTYTMWMRCQDANGNKNEDAVAIRYCVQKGPDTTAPEIKSTSIVSGSPVQFNADRVEIEVYTNEPAQCRWSKEEKSYEIMENSLSCARNIYEVNADFNFICSGELKGIENKKDNNFYFRCQDYSKDGPNTMTSSYPLVLRGTEQLVIKSVLPNGTITGGVNDVGVELSVETLFGESDGRALCYYQKGSDGVEILMEETDAATHKQTAIQLPSGSYNFNFRCTDLGGNTATATTSFNVLVDRDPPQVVRIYQDENKLKIITNEEAKCAYSLTSCEFNIDEAQSVFLYENPARKLVHFADWNADSAYFIKCEDLNGNGPVPPNTCQVIARGSEF